MVILSYLHIAGQRIRILLSFQVGGGALVLEQNVKGEGRNTG